jgi:DNA-binding LacI/PurR family transcriptional regulator
MILDKTGLMERALREAIEQGKFAPGSAIPSERQLMEEHALSRTTVRRAIDALVEAGRLERRPGSGTFVIDRLASIRPAKLQPMRLALIIPTFSSPFYGEMIDGMEQAARSHDLKIMASQSDYRQDNESEQLLEAAKDPTIAGAVVVPGAVDGPAPGALRLIEAGKPLVYVGRWPKGLKCDTVCTDYLAAAKLAVEHLIALGHRSIAYVEGAPHFQGFSPQSGYSEALKDARIAQRPELVCLSDLPPQEAGQAAVSELIRRGVAFSAVFARNDVTAVGVMRALREAGLNIPADVSVAAINNSLLARSLEPPVTTVDPYPSTLGRLALKLLLDRVLGGYDGPPIRMTLEPSLNVRASSGAPPEKGRGHG